MDNILLPAFLYAALSVGAGIFYRIIAFELPLTAFLGMAIFKIAEKHPNIGKPLGLCALCNTMWIAAISGIFECIYFSFSVPLAAAYFIAKIFFTSLIIKICHQ